ncbi:MAG: radical SAM/SPASM domain-containing protein [Rhodospirillaceae bacterium]
MQDAGGIKERLDRIRSLAAAERSSTPPPPRSAKLELTSDCNLNCLFCARTRQPRVNSEMPWPLFTRVAHELSNAGVEQLGLFYMGEPLLCEWLSDAIRYAKRECGYRYVFVTTNGTGASPNRVRACIAAGLDSLKFALNFSGPKQLQELAGGAAAQYRLLVRNVEGARRVRDELLSETGHRCALYGSSLLYDDEQRVRMYKALRKLLPSLDEHYWLPLYGHMAAPGLRATPPHHIARPVSRKALPCWSLFTEAHVTCDGELSACCLDASPRFHMGDLTTTPFTQVWHGARFQALRAAHLAGDVRGTACESCLAY